MSEQDVAVGALFRQYVKEVTIAECAKISRSSPSASKADKKDARNHILLLTGAIDGYFDQHGKVVTTAENFIRTTPYPEEAEAVRRVMEVFA